MIDRLIAALLGLICGLVMAGVWGFVGIRMRIACVTIDSGINTDIECYLYRTIIWLLLAGPPLVGLIFGFDRMLDLLSRLWGTKRRPYGDDFIHFGSTNKGERTANHGFAEYGHRHLDFIYNPVMTIFENGILHKRQWYRWQDIDQIRIWKKAPTTYVYAPESAYAPRAEVILKSGQMITLKGESLEKHKRKLQDGFLSAFDELVHEIKKRHRESRVPQVEINR